MSQQINLFNPIFLQQRKQFSAVTMAQGLALISIAVLAFSGYHSYQAKQVGKDAAAAALALKATQERLIKAVERNKPAPPDKQVLNDIQKVEERLRASRHILAFVQNGELMGGQGYARFLQAFSSKTMTGVWLTGIAIDDGGDDIEITGRSVAPELVPAYIRSLNTEKAFMGKSLGSLMLRAQQNGTAIDTAKATTAAPAARTIEFTLSSSEAGQGMQPGMEASGK